MSASTFESRIRNRFTDVQVVITSEDGKHNAWFPTEGVSITASTTSHIATVNWGSGHCAQWEM